MPDKIIVTNETALSAKYGAGLATIQAAVARLIAADAVRGLQTVYIPLDDAAAMAASGIAAITAPADEQQNKDAVDSLYQAIAPDYILLLGAPDVVPHQSLNNILFDGGNDSDQITPSDLPYACDAPFSTDPNDFISPTRIVGRLPDVAGSNDADAFAAIIDAAAAAVSLASTQYAGFFAISAERWQVSTGLSLAAIFGAAGGMHTSPADGPGWSAADLNPLSHFINCHGSAASTQFFGQDAAAGTTYPVADDAAGLAGNLAAGTVAAIESCYGAELFDPSLTGGQAGIANTYVAAGSYGYWGSTNIAYGPADSNGAADLICQYYLKHVLSAESSGRAAANARLDFIAAASMADKINVKTLAQFILLGDPSVQPIAAPAAAPAMLAHVMGALAATAARDERVDRRKRLIARGRELSRTGAVSSRASVPASTGMMNQLRAISAENGLVRTSIKSFPVERAESLGNAVPKAMMLKAPDPTVVHVILGAESPGAGDGPTAARTVALVVTETNGTVTRVRKLYGKARYDVQREGGA